MKKNIVIILGIIILAVFLRFAYGQAGRFMANRMPHAAPEVVVAEIGEMDVIRTFEAPGRVVSKYRVIVGSRISGFLLASYFKEGDFVKTGQDLFLIEPEEYQNAANVAKADVETFKAQLIYAEKQLARGKELVEKDYIAKAQYDNLLSTRDALRASLASAQARHADALRNLGYTRVKAGVDGQIGVINVTVGNFLAPGITPELTTINSTNPIFVTFPLEINDFTLLSQSDGANAQNRKVEVILPGGVLYEKTGVQDFKDNKVDESTGTVTMRATFQNPDNELINGTFVTVKLYANHPVNVPVVPQVAVQENQAGKYVYKLDEKDIPQLVYIKTDEQEGDFYIVTEGLQKGDRIVVDGVQKVVPGKPVKIIEGK